MINKKPARRKLLLRYAWIAFLFVCTVSLFFLMWLRTNEITIGLVFASLFAFLWVKATTPWGKLRLDQRDEQFQIDEDVL